MGMVVPFPKPERSWRASLLIFLVDCWSKKSASSSGSRGTVSSSIWALSRLLDLLSLRLPLAHLAQSIALQSSSCKNMQNSQVLSRDQTPKQAWIVQFWRWVWLSPSPSLNGPDEPSRWSSWWTAGRKNHHHQARNTASSSICALSRLLDLLYLRLSLAQLAQSMALQSSPCKDMQNSQVLSWKQAPKQAFPDSTVLAMSMVVPFPEPERSWRASLLIFLVDCWSTKSSSSLGSRQCILVHLAPPNFWTCSPCVS